MPRPSWNAPASAPSRPPAPTWRLPKPMCAPSEADNDQAQADLARMKPLVDKAEISQQQYDAYVAAAKVAASRFARRPAEAGIRAQKDAASQARPPSRPPRSQLDRAKAQVDVFPGQPQAGGHPPGGRRHRRRRRLRGARQPRSRPTPAQLYHPRRAGGRRGYPQERRSGPGGAARSGRSWPSSR